jgi:hypothetical protein
MSRTHLFCSKKRCVSFFVFPEELEKTGGFAKLKSLSIKLAVKSIEKKRKMSKKSDTIRKKSVKIMDGVLKQKGKQFTPDRIE